MLSEKVLPFFYGLQAHFVSIEIITSLSLIDLLAKNIYQQSPHGDRMTPKNQVSFKPDVEKITFVGCWIVE